MKKCDECGMEYEHPRHCEFCARRNQWDRHVKGPFLESLFSPRIVRDLALVFIPRGKLEQDLEWISKTSGGLYIHGPVGSGKTLYAAALTAYAAEHSFVVKDEGWKTFSFIPVSQLLFDIKSTFGHDRDLDESSIVDEYSECDWLVLDDLGAERASEWTFQTLYLIINRRYESLRTTLFTSNLSLTSLSQKLQDDRIVSRIMSMCRTRSFRQTLRKPIGDVNE